MVTRKKSEKVDSKKKSEAEEFKVAVIPEEGTPVTPEMMDEAVKIVKDVKTEEETIKEYKKLVGRFSDVFTALRAGNLTPNEAITKLRRIREEDFSVNMQQALVLAMYEGKFEDEARTLLATIINER